MFLKMKYIKARCEMIHDFMKGGDVKTGAQSGKDERWWRRGGLCACVCVCVCVYLCLYLSSCHTWMYIFLSIHDYMLI